MAVAHAVPAVFQRVIPVARLKGRTRDQTLKHIFKRRLVRLVQDSFLEVPLELRRADKPAHQFLSSAIIASSESNRFAFVRSSRNARRVVAFGIS